MPSSYFLYNKKPMRQVEFRVTDPKAPVTLWVLNWGKTGTVCLWYVSNNYAMLAVFTFFSAHEDISDIHPFKNEDTVEKR